MWSHALAAARLPLQSKRAEPLEPSRFMAMTEPANPFRSGAWLHQATRQADAQMDRGDRRRQANAGCKAA
jgi:hypothetical protein